MEAAVPGALAAKAGFGLLQGLSGFSAAQAERQQSENNAYIGRTRAIQSDTDARLQTEGEIGTLRAQLLANGGLPSVGTFDMFREVRDIRERERRINFGNRMQEVYDFETAGRNASRRGTVALGLGAARAAQPIFSLYDYYGGA